jgi:MULE transposase domain
MTTSEREDVHKAIVCCLREAVPVWVPELLMTDMAFSAYNAWKSFFPELKWLWCVFHLWQAWIKRLKQAQRPDALSKNDWSILKRQLIRAIKELICLLP